MKTHDTKKTQTIIIAYNLHMYIQFYNSTILQENTRHQKNSIAYYLHIFNSTILQFYDSTGKHMSLKKLKLHCILLTYIQFYNSTILRFYRKRHVTKKTQTSLTATY